MFLNGLRFSSVSLKKDISCFEHSIKDFGGPSNYMQNQMCPYFEIYGLNILNFIDFPLGYKFEVKI